MIKHFKRSHRSMILHPFFLNRLVCVILIFEASSILLLDLADPFSFINCINLTSILLGIIGLVLTLAEKAKLFILFSGLLLAIILPTLNILFNEADLRLTIFSLPLAYILELGVAGHAIKNKTLGILSVILLVGLLIPMTQTPIMIHSGSLGIQIILILLIAITGFVLLVMYTWNKNKAYLLNNEKQLIDRIGSLIDIFSNRTIVKKNVQEALSLIVTKILPSLEFEDCVIYLLDKEKNILHQQLAYGNKKAVDGTEVINPLAIPVGLGIVGAVAQTGIPELIANTSLDERYIADDKIRYSELCVPIIADNQVIGVIDSEHSSKNFFNEIHLYLMQIIAAQCAALITEIEHRSIYEQSVELEVKTNKLQETNLIKSRFISNLSHDLKTPLTLILGPSKELTKYQLDSANLEVIQEIQKNGNELKDIIDELLTLNEVNFLSQQSSISKIDIGLLMLNWQEQFTHRAGHKNVKITWEGDSSLTITADEKKITLIVFSLFEKALHQCPEGGSIRLKYYTNENEFVWKLAYAVDEKQENGPIQGQLDLVKQIIHETNGKIILQTTPEFHEIGVSFSLIHTTGVSENEIQDNLHRLDDISQKPIILVIEDHHELSAFIQSSLEDEFITVTSETGETGIEMAKKFIPDLIITDLMLPGMSGEEVCATIQKEDQINHIPIIVLSAKSMTLDRVELYRLGAENYLTKPFELEELRAIIRNTIHQRELIKTAFRAKFNTSELAEEDPFLAKTIALIEQNLEDASFNISALTKVLEMGRSQFQRKIKMLTNMTPVEFLRTIRLKKARTLIRTSDNTISEIAYAVGFNNLSYFTRVYKQAFNELPSETVEKTKNH